jgi:hypothetical protein
MKTIFLTILMATAFAAHGQIRKCIGADGKVTYSDFVCAQNTSNETAVRAGHNTIDSSGYRQEARRMNDDKAVNAALQTDGEKCKFSYYVSGDAHGKTLADSAKKECLNNIKAKTLGQPTSLEAYGFWKDHSTQESSNRQAAMSRAAAAAGSNNIVNSINNQTRDLQKPIG